MTILLSAHPNPFSLPDPSQILPYRHTTFFKCFVTAKNDILLTLPPLVYGQNGQEFMITSKGEADVPQQRGLSLLQGKLGLQVVVDNHTIDDDLAVKGPRGGPLWIWTPSICTTLGNASVLACMVRDCDNCFFRVPLCVLVRSCAARLCEFVQFRTNSQS